MGKKIIYKELRKMAATLPALSMPITVGEKRVSGAKLIEELGEEAAKLKGITDAKGFYDVKRNGYIPLNHERRLKEAYNRGGLAAAAVYIKAIVARKAELDAAGIIGTVKAATEESYEKSLTQVDLDMIAAE